MTGRNYQHARARPRPLSPVAPMVCLVALLGVAVAWVAVLVVTHVAG